MRAAPTSRLSESEAWRFDCRGKVPFRNERHAKGRAREIRRESGENLHAYKCKACKHFHLGHN